MKEKSPNLHTLAIHIGTGFVEGALIEESAHKEGVPLIDAVERIPIGFGSSRVRSALLEHTNTALKKLLARYSNEKVSFVKITLSSPWYHASVRTVHSSSHTPTAISRKSVLETVQKHKDQAPPKSGREDLEAIAMQVQVNGYPTSLESNRIEGTTVKIHLYESEVDSDIKKTFFELAENTFPHSQVSLHSFPLVYALGVREITTEKNFIALEVGAEVSDVAVVHNDAIQYLATIPFGYHSLARSLAGTDTNDTLADTLSKLALYARDELSNEEKQKTKVALETVFGDWRKEFENILKTASAYTPIPRKIFLLTEKNQAGWVAEGVRAFTETSHTLEILNQQSLNSLVKGGERATYNTALSLVTLFFHLTANDIFGSSEATTSPHKKGFFFRNSNTR